MPQARENVAEQVKIHSFNWLRRDENLRLGRVLSKTNAIEATSPRQPPCALVQICNTSSQGTQRRWPLTMRLQFFQNWISFYFFFLLSLHSQSTTLGTFSHEISRQSMAYIQRNRGQLDTCIPLLLSTLLSKRTRRVSHSMTILNDPQFGCFRKWHVHCLHDLWSQSFYIFLFHPSSHRRRHLTL